MTDTEVSLRSAVDSRCWQNPAVGRGIVSKDPQCQRLPARASVCQQRRQETERREAGGGRREAGGGRREAGGGRLFSPARVTTHHPDHDAADLHFIDDDRIQFLIGGLQAKLLLSVRS